MQVRRVVTGHSPQGKAVFASDMRVDGITVSMAPGVEFHRLWGGDSAPTFPDDGSPREGPAYFPPLGGYRFGLFTLPPGVVVPPEGLDMQAATAEAEARLPGMLAVLEPDGLTHRTDTVDFEYVVSGEVWLQLDDGAEMHLRAGDTVVQNGTRHAWHNKGSVPCTMVVVLIGARRA